MEGLLGKMRGLFPHSLIGVITVVVSLGLSLAGLIAVGQWARARLQGLSGSTVAFMAIDCAPPPGQTRAEFLSEVQYQSGLPARLPLTEEGLAGRLADAFAHHPYVATVERVEITPAHAIHVDLIYRRPIMSVHMIKGNGTHKFQVDANGVHLGAVTDANLPTYEWQGTNTADGRKWDEQSLRAAARTAAFLRPHQNVIRLKRLTGTAERLELEGAWDGAIIWGRPPGTKRAGEPLAQVKLTRLLEYLRHSGTARDSAAEPYDLRRDAASADGP